MKLEKIIRKTQQELTTYTANFLRSLRYDVQIGSGYVYAKGTVPVMLVAHLDTVHRTPVQRIFYTKDGTCLMSPEGIGGDDRCGVYMALRIAEKLHCHILFCQDEEVGGIGAEAFAKSNVKPSINYIIEFDRRGSNDAVFYDCGNEDFVKFVQQFGFREEYGSFSDISIIAPALKVAAVNLSSGYYNAHTNHEYINTVEMADVMERAIKMINTQSEQFEYIDAFASKYSWRSNAYLYTPGSRQYIYEGCEFISLKPLTGDEYKFFGSEAMELDENFCLGEDDKVYEYHGDFDVVTMYQGYVLDGQGMQPRYEDLRGEEYMCEVISNTDLFDLYEDPDAYYDMLWNKGK